MHVFRQIAQGNRRLRIAVLAALPFLCYGLLRFAAALYREFVMDYVPMCPMRMVTGWRCPSCGMTHSVFALCRLDIAAALRENAVIPVMVLLLLLLYAECWLSVFGVKRHLLPRSGIFRTVLLLAWLLYAVLRNLWH